MDFTIENTFDGGSWRVNLSGEIDIYNSSDLKAKLTGLMTEKPADIHINCKTLEYIDSTGLGALVGVLKHVKDLDREVYLSNVRPSITKLLRITKLDKVFIIEEG